MLATQVLPDEYFETESKKEDESDLVGFIVAENKHYEIRKGESKIGRDPAVCSIVLNNNTVSKLHAVIESEGKDDTFIYDVGSTNSVRLGKKSLKPHYRYKLDDGSVITFGNVVAKFVFSPETSDTCSGFILQTPVSQGEVNLKLEDLDLGDIFDVATQVNVPQPSTSNFDNTVDNFQTFKIPNSVPSIRKQAKSSSEISENCFANLNENKLKPDEADRPVAFGLSAIDDSNIFSLETQAQIDTSPNTVENATETILNNSNDAIKNLDRVNSLLNDGQDDILCTFMSMHSPKRNDESTSHEIVIKTEPIEEPDVFEIQTQIEGQSAPENSVVEKEIALLTEDLQKDKNFVEEFFDQAQNDSHRNQSQTEKESGDINSTNSTLNNKFVLKSKEKLEKGDNSKEIDSQENYSQDFTQVRSQDEDFVQTQEYFMENFFKPTDIQSKVHRPLSKDPSENSDTESCLEVALEDSPKFDRTKTDNSDFTHPVKFMEFEEVKKNSSHLFQGEFISAINEKSIKKEFDIDNDDKNVECSLEGNSDKDDTQSFLEICVEDLPNEDKSPDKVNKSTGEEETTKEGNDSSREKSKMPVPVQTILTKLDNGTSNEDNEDDFEDFIETQRFDNPVINKIPNGDDNDETQIFELPALQNLNGLKKDTINVDAGRSSPDLLSDEDFIRTQPFNEGDGKGSKSFGGVLSESRGKDVNQGKRGQVVPALENSDDETEPYLKLEEDHDQGLHPEGKNIFKLNESKDSKELDHHNQSRGLLLEENENSDSSFVFQLEEEDQGKETDLITVENVKLERVQESWKENKGPVCVDSDSDATDCEQIDVIQGNAMPIKEEIIEKAAQGETQVLTLTLPENFAERQYNEKEDGWMRGGESPKFEMIGESDNESNHSWSQLSLKMPSTQDVEKTLEKLLKSGNEKVSGQMEEEKSAKASTRKEIPMETKKTEPQTSTILQTLTRGKNLPSMEEGGSRRLFDSPVKRNRDKDNTVEVVPIKKSRTSINSKNDTPSTSGEKPITNTQKVLLKLWQTHDIAQIQPTRTRSSLKNMETEGNQNKNKVTDNNEAPPNRRRSTRLGSASKRQKTDMNPNIHKKIEEAKRSFQNVRRRDSNRQNERFSTEQDSESGGTRVLRRRNGCDLVRLNNSFDGTSSFEMNVGNNISRRFSKTGNDKSSNVQVVFTGFDCEPLEKVVSELGGVRTNDLSSGTVVVADKVRRTVKFLCAIGLGLPITSPQWLWLSKKANKFLNPWNYLLKEEESEEKWDFDLKKVLERSKKKKLLEGYSVFATENVKPPVKDLLTIVECCGGIPLIHHPEKWPKKTIVVSCLEDMDSWPPTKLRNVKIVHYEFILSGVLRQKIDFKTYKLR